MQSTYRFKTHGTCSQAIEITVDGDTIRQVEFIGGCNGNTQGIARLVVGMPIDDVITRLTGINCGGRGTSCPDQLATALRKIRAQS